MQHRSEYQSPQIEEVELIFQDPVLTLSSNLGDLGNNNVYQEEF